MIQWPAHYCQQHKSLEVKLEQRDRSFYNHVTRNRTVSKREQYQFYKTKLWRSLRLSILGRDLHLCQYCKAMGVIAMGNTIDHVVPFEVKPEWKDRTDNLLTCCPGCHKFKTRWEQSYYGTGQANAIRDVELVTDVKRVASIIFGMKSTKNDFDTPPAKLI